jgi:hemolysin III
MSILDFREPVSAWSHCAGLLLALPGTILLWRRSSGALVKRLTVVIYGLTLALCYLASTLYHGVRLPQEGIAAFARLDGVGIFALIAGSYTPMAYCLLRLRPRS